MTSLLENCCFSMLYTVCLHSMPHSVHHSMPHSMPIQYASVCLHTLSYTLYPAQYASQQLKSQNKILKIF